MYTYQYIYNISVQEAMEGENAAPRRKRTRVINKKRTILTMYQIEDVHQLFDKVSNITRACDSKVYALTSDPNTILKQMQTSFSYEFPHLQLTAVSAR
mgnify:FL=1